VTFIHRLLLVTETKDIVCFSVCSSQFLWCTSGGWRHWGEGSDSFAVSRYNRPEMYGNTISRS